MIFRIIAVRAENGSITRKETRHWTDFTLYEFAREYIALMDDFIIEEYGYVLTNEYHLDGHSYAMWNDNKGFEMSIDMVIDD